MDGAPGLTGEESALYAVVPPDGATVGNQRAQETLGWTDDVYWRVRDSLVDRGLISRGRGRGGTLRRVIESPPADVITVPVDIGRPDEAAANIVESIRREEELYEPMSAVLRGDWVKDRRTNPIAVELTARQGRRATGGTWSRPDLVSVEIKTFEYVPGKFLEVVTFEIKPSDAIDVQAVYEALAHRRAATHAYVLLHVPGAAAASLEDAIQNVRLVARSHGIGVVIAADPSDYSTWEELEEAQRVEPDPERLNSFIDTQLSDKLKRRIARALR
jgi:hypothetical protein